VRWLGSEVSFYLFSWFCSVCFVFGVELGGVCAWRFAEFVILGATADPAVAPTLGMAAVEPHAGKEMSMVFT
jgi:hypothetical protein